MMKKILILGAGFGGLETATGLAQALDKKDYEITLIDKNDSFFIGFSKIDVLFGRATAPEVSHRYQNLREDGIRFIQDTITSIDSGRKLVETEQHTLSYDYLVVGLGADFDYEAVPGFTQSGGFEFYSMKGAEKLAPVLKTFTSGTIVLGIFSMPYKCPPAPYEVACQLVDFFRDRGIRDGIDLKIVVPGPRPVKNPNVSEMLEKQLSDHDIELVANTPIESIDANAKRVITRDGDIPYDLFIGVPVHTPPSVVRNSKISDGGFIPVNTVNLETAIPDVYAIGDVTKIPAGEEAVPKAGAFAEDAARTVVSDILRKEGFRSDVHPFHARGACYFELGSGEVAKLDANFLGGEKPDMVVYGPSRDFQKDKEHFATSKCDRWFR